MEPEIEIAFFVFFVLFLGGMAWIFANNSKLLPRIVNLFRYKSEDEVCKKDSESTSHSDNKVEEETETNKEGK